MDFNFFTWLRDSVRQSILMGVSDAVGQIGTPDKEADLHPDVAALLQAAPENGKIESSNATTKRRRSASTTGRKRLGKSLQDIK